MSVLSGSYPHSDFGVVHGEISMKPAPFFLIGAQVLCTFSYYNRVRLSARRNSPANDFGAVERFPCQDVNAHAMQFHEAPIL